MINRVGIFILLLAVTAFGGILFFSGYIATGNNNDNGNPPVNTHEIRTGAGVIPANETVDSSNRSIDASRRTAIVKAAEVVSPAVVSLTVTQERVLQRRSLLDDFYADFWGWYVPPRRYIQKIQSLGSGVIIDPEGYIITNAHVVSDARNIRVVLPGGSEYEGKVVGQDNTLDLAVIKIDGENLPYAKLGDSDSLIIGEWVIAFGNPFGHLMEDTEPTVTVGVISALHRDIKRDPEQVQIFKDMIQTDAAINPGNSGGPLADALGEVIGINTFIFTSSRGSEGIGFAIPINRVKSILHDLIEHGEVVRAWVGLYVQKITPLLAQSLDLPVTRGVIIADVDKDSPAESAGLKRGDILVKADGKGLYDENDWELFENMARPGRDITLSIIRKGQEKEIKLKPVESISALSSAQRDKFGLFVSNITPGIARQYRADMGSGVVVLKIDPNSIAASWDVQPGDIIRQIGRLNVSDTNDYFNILKKVDKGDRLTFIIERNDAIFYLTVRY
jgi:serine protease Do